MRVLALLIVVAACQSSETVDVAYLAAPRADVALRQAEATVTNTSNTTWSLTKVGSLGTSTITWQATATEGVSSPGLIIVNGIFRVENRGTAGATIGNIVVNLQKKVANKWVSVSADVADATQDDAATTANVAAKNTADNVSSFTENSASGPLLFTDATTNSAFALVPQVTIAPKAIQKLRFSATYDNNVLNIPVDTQLRVEIIVSFGNARAGGTSTPNIDINGNGIIDADEQYVQSVAGKVTTSLPAPAPSNSNVVLTDSPSDITTTGTVTFSNPQITINGTQAFVVVNYDGGASGGTITNCAHLTGTGSTALVAGDSFTNLTAVDLTACSTITVGPHTCTPGSPSCGWETGELVTYGQENWGLLGTTASNLLINQFFNVYNNGVGVEIGISGAGGNSAIFDSPEAILDYQPSTGQPGPLDNDLLNPLSTSSGLFGGHVLAVQLDVDFADDGHLSGSSGLIFGDLRVCGTEVTGLNGATVRQALAALNLALGGGTRPFCGGIPCTYDALSDLAQSLSNSFESGSPSLFAQDHLVNAPTCP